MGKDIHKIRRSITIALSCLSLTSLGVGYTIAAKSTAGDKEFYVTFLTITFGFLGAFVKLVGGIHGFKRTFHSGSIQHMIHHIPPISPQHQSKLANDKAASKVVIISDTHMFHKDLTDKIPACDILIHCGDFTMLGGGAEINDFVEWFGKLTQCKHKVLIAGNHEMGLDEDMFHSNRADKLEKFGLSNDPLLKTPEQREELRQRLRSVCYYLFNESVEINGLKIWGSPYTPWISPKAGMGFQRDQEDLKEIWKNIPNDVDILLTHGPSKGHGDRNLVGMLCGCKYLIEKINQIKPQYHLFGHIHEGERVSYNDDTVFLNASTCNIRYQPIQEILTLYIKPKKLEAESTDNE